MDLFNIHTKILMPFVDETIKVLREMADLTATAGQGIQENTADYDFKGYAVCIVARTYGSIEGKIIMNHQIKTALTVGNRFRAKMFGEPCNFDTINEEIGEALTEFSNTVIGLATRHLSSSDAQLNFSAPLFINGPKDMDYVLEGVKEILSIPIDVKGVGTFYFSYLLHQKTN